MSKRLRKRSKWRLKSSICQVRVPSDGLTLKRIRDTDVFLRRERYHLNKIHNSNLNWMDTCKSIIIIEKSGPNREVMAILAIIALSTNGRRRSGIPTYYLPALKKQPDGRWCELSKSVHAKALTIWNMSNFPFFFLSEVFRRQEWEVFQGPFENKAMQFLRRLWPFECLIPLRGQFPQRWDLSSHGVPPRWPITRQGP
jgi:hypothetical protein